MIILVVLVRSNNIGHIGHSVLSAGPLANIFIHKLYLANSNNIYIDCGSSIDVFNKNKYTRPFQSSVFHQDEINLHFQY